MPQTIIGPDDPALNVMRSALAAQPELDTELVIIPWAEYRDRLLTTLIARCDAAAIQKRPLPNIPGWKLSDGCLIKVVVYPSGLRRLKS